MKIHAKETARGELLLQIEGKLTIDSVQIFEKTVNPYFGKSISSIALDCRGLDFIDSSGIGTLMTAANRAKTAGMDFHLTGVSSGILTIFRTANIESFFTIKGR